MGFVTPSDHCALCISDLCKNTGEFRSSFIFRRVSFSINDVKSRSKSRPDQDHLSIESDGIMSFLLDVPALRPIKKKGKRRNSLAPTSEPIRGGGLSPVQPMLPLSQAYITHSSVPNLTAKSKSRRQSYAE